MIKERSLLLDLQLREILLPLCFEELKGLKFDLLGAVLLQVLKARPALVERGVVDLASKHEVVRIG